MGDGAVKVAEHAFHGSEMRDPWIMEVEAELLYSMCDVRKGESEILKGTDNRAIKCGIGHWGTGGCSKLPLGINRSRDGLTGEHTSALKNLMRKLCLVKE